MTQVELREKRTQDGIGVTFILKKPWEVSLARRAVLSQMLPVSVRDTAELAEPLGRVWGEGADCDSWDS